ncbi:hypothetical protein SpCBS45565_g07133 [Spizellomyces sp. 'palustris']|nr:hypothetical protein SpCBS45565_g07133 [Spizellomyces sp. 'palustris']
MSFKLNWPTFSAEFMEKAQQQLTIALNKGEKPSNIVGKIEVKGLNMGTKPPDLEILEIGELQEERFRGIFKMAYIGDAYVELQTKVQANPLRTPNTTLKINNRGGILAANWPLVVPMRLRISNLVLRGIIVLVVDKHKGVTLVFKNDPLEKVDVNSTFDNIPNIRRFLQLQIETQLRKMFQEDLPALIHNLSLVYLQQKNGGSTNSGQAWNPSNQLSTENTPKRHVEHDEISSLDSGYHSDEPMAGKQTEPRTQREKWIGNDPIDDDEDDDAWVHGYIFYRNLSASSGAADYGLKNLSVPKPLLSDRVVSRSRTVERQNWESMSYIAFSDPGPYSTPRRRNSNLSDHSLHSAGSVSSLRHPYMSYESFSTRPRLPPRAPSSASLDVDFGRGWTGDHYDTRSLKPSVSSHAESDSRWPSTDLNAQDDHNSNSRGPVQFPSRIVLKPTDNPLAAHLANLMNSNHTISPHTQSEDIEHLAFRAHPGKNTAKENGVVPVGGPGSSQSAPQRSWRTRNVMRIKLPPGVVVPQGLISPGLTERMLEAGLHPQTGAPLSEDYRRDARWRKATSVKSDGAAEGGERRLNTGMVRAMSTGGLSRMALDHQQPPGRRPSHSSQPVLTQPPSQRPPLPGDVRLKQRRASSRSTVSEDRVSIDRHRVRGRRLSSNGSQHEGIILEEPGSSF